MSSVPMRFNRVFVPMSDHHRELIVAGEPLTLITTKAFGISPKRIVSIDWAAYGEDPGAYVTYWESAGTWESAG